MLIVQPISSFGDLICMELDTPTSSQEHWQTFEFAVAWVNSLVATRIKDSAKRFLSNGGRISATVGLDFGSTSYEGLGILLDLEDEWAHITTHVFHDKNPACTFHPKVYLFSNSNNARLFVGSNYMTGAGVGTNIEAALGVTGALSDETILAARQALEGWRDVSSEPKRTLRLTRDILKQLLDEKFVRTEEEIRRERRQSRQRSRPLQGSLLFASSTSAGSPGNRSGAANPDRDPGVNTGLVEVLLMRVQKRRAKKLKDGTRVGKQIQISLHVHKSGFMREIMQVISASDQSPKEIHYQYRKSKKTGKRVRNNIAFEAPEIELMKLPVARFRWVGGNALQYEVFDADIDAEGAKILKKLEEGIASPPEIDLEKLSRNATVLSKSDRLIAQWYRLDSI